MVPAFWDQADHATAHGALSLSVTRRAKRALDLAERSFLRLAHCNTAKTENAPLRTSLGCLLSNVDQPSLEPRSVFSSVRIHQGGDAAQHTRYMLGSRDVLTPAMKGSLTYVAKRPENGCERVWVCQTVVRGRPRQASTA